MLSAGRPIGRMSGHSLSELMIATALGLFVISGVTYLYTDVIKGSNRLYAEAHLHQTLAALSAVMTSELRRAGYWSRARDALGGATVNGYAPVNLASDSCVLFSYDQDSGSTDGRPRDQDQHGLRLAGDTVQIKTSDAHCGATTCTSCTTGTWWAMTDPQSVMITGLSFGEAHHQQPIGEEAAVVVRNIQVVIEGTLRRDPAVRADITTLVNVRNDEIR